MNTLYGLDVTTQWDKILEVHALALGKVYRPDWYRWKLTNNFERAVFLKGDPVLPRETSRYLWANENHLGSQIVEIGCSTGYGSQFFGQNIEYIGLDYDPIIVQVAKEQNWGVHRHFVNVDINTYDLGFCNTIIAFEVIEHLDNGLEIVEKLKDHCNRLLISVPHNEPKGFWGEHHKLHGLNESDFPTFSFSYVNEHGYISNDMQALSPQNTCNLMLARWDRG